MKKNNHQHKSEIYGADVK